MDDSHRFSRLLTLRRLPRSVMVAALACLLMAAPAAARALIPSTTAVSVKITTHPAADVRSTSAKFGWKATGTKLSVSCRLGSGAYAKCSKTHTYTKLKAGAHSFTVRAVSGKTTRTAVYRWTVDTVAPTAPTVSGGSAVWTRSNVAIKAAGSTDVGGTGIGSYQYRASVDSGAHWSAVASGSTLTVSSTGTTWVQFRAVDRAGNPSAWAPTVPNDPSSTAMIDKLVPTVPGVASGAGAWSKVASVVVAPTVASSDAGGSGFGASPYQFRTSLNQGAWTTPSSGGSTTISAEGQTEVEFRSIDVAANISAWSPPVEVWLDRTAPTFTITSSPAIPASGWSKSATTVSAAPDATGSPITAEVYRFGTSGTGLAYPAPAISTAGTTVVEFQATDAAGNTSAWTAPTTVKLDLTAPTVPTVSGGSLTWKLGPTPFTASGSTDSGGSGLGPYQYQTSTDNGATWSAIANAPASIAANGTTTTIVEMRATDNAGNVSAWTSAVSTAANTAKLDNAGPTTPAVAGGGSAWATGSVTFTASGSTDSGSGFNHYEYETSTDSGANWSLPTTGTSKTISADGTTWITFRAVDALGNKSPWSTDPVTGTAPPPSIARIDHTVPTITVSGGSASWSNAASAKITPTGADATSGVNAASYQYQTSNDGGTTWQPVAAGATATITREGNTLVEFRVSDNAGNPSLWSAPAEVHLDRSAPSVPVPTGGSSGWTNAATVTLSAGGSTDTWSGLDPTNPYQFRTKTNTGAWTSPANGSSVDISAEGTTQAQFRAVDAVGNLSGWSVATLPAATVNIDRIDPTMPTVSGGSSSWTTAASVTVTASGSTDTNGSGVASYEYELSRPTHGGGWPAPPTAGSSAVISTQGLTLVRFRAVDRAGNVSAWGPTNTTSASEAAIDNVAPLKPTVTPTAGCPAHTNTVNAYADDSIDGSGAAFYNYKINSGSGYGAVKKTPTQVGNVDMTASGQIMFQAVDFVGLASPWSDAAQVCVS